MEGVGWDQNDEQKHTATELTKYNHPLEFLATFTGSSIPHVLLPFPIGF